MNQWKIFNDENSERNFENDRKRDKIQRARGLFSERNKKEIQTRRICRKEEKSPQTPENKKRTE